MTIRVVLASASPARLAVLRAAGLDPIVVVSDVDEEQVLAATTTRVAVGKVALLARAKALAVTPRAAALADGGPVVVIGCDSMLEIGGELVGKPHTPEVARERWRVLSGATATLHTGHAVCMLTAGREWTTTVTATSTTVRFAEVSDAEIDAYVATAEPLEVAGAFTLDGYGGWFVESIDGDPSNVLGISLPVVRTMLAGLGVAVTDLWTRPDPQSDSDQR